MNVAEIKRRVFLDVRSERVMFNGLNLGGVNVATAPPLSKHARIGIWVPKQLV